VTSPTVVYGSLVNPFFISNDADADAGDTSVNTDNLYAYWISANVKPVEMLTIDAYAAIIPKKYVTSIGFDGNDDGVATAASPEIVAFDMGFTTFGAKLSLAMGALSASFGTDVVMTSEEFGGNGDETMHFDLSPVVSYKVAEGFDFSVKAWAVGSDTGEDVDMPLNIDFNVTEDLATGFVPNLGATVDFALDDVLGDNDADDDDFEWYLDVGISYLLAEGLTAAADFGTGIDETMTFGASLALAPAFHNIANTTFTIAFDDFATAKAAADENKGVFTIAAAIAF